ncbi:cobalt-precorrin 5A hydrolase [Tepidibacter aestuarii]|uniref:cobalt-precorrin 5A hydrolase n=1 Tax=Tepidibacter aestuarii TaxID=2925782 RepID=UPI0020BF6AB3|nr:cobalt-precorrin 5A hydrolase [Tepidibacter aestuarii]CAH2212012.1 Cobalamin biosynthesis protein CbiG (hydrolase) [Tepidibacter aestuarii]
MNTESNKAVIALTSNGKNLALNIKKYMKCDVYVNNKILCDNTMPVKGKFKEFVGEIFYKYDYLIFIMATGIVVRSICPYIKDKTQDPAIIVMDEKGNNVISLLSGHIGGANEMTIKLSDYLNSNPVITTATDVNNKSALDMIIKKIDAHIDDFKQNVKRVNSYLVEGKKVGIYMEENYDIDTRGFVLIKDKNNIKDIDTLIYITNKKYIDIKHKDIIKLTPKNIVLSVGCRRDIDSNLMYESFEDFLNKKDIDINSIKVVGSVDLKKYEKAIIDLANKLGVKFEIVSREEILKVEDKFEKSEFVKKSIGVYSVVEPVSYILSGENLIANKTKYKGITFGLGRLK